MGDGQPNGGQGAIEGDALQKNLTSSTTGLITSSLIKLIGDVLVTYLSHPREDGVASTFTNIRNNKWFRWILIIGICVIAVGAFVDGIGKIVGGILSLAHWIASFKN